jgi:hypothetical protein
MTLLFMFGWKLLCTMFYMYRIGSIQKVRICVCLISCNPHFSPFYTIMCIWFVTFGCYILLFPALADICIIILPERTKTPIHTFIAFVDLAFGRDLRIHIVDKYYKVKCQVLTIFFTLCCCFCYVLP